MQETHSTTADEKEWTKEWGGEIHFNHGSNDSRGVAILIKSNSFIKVLRNYCDKQGRILILNTSIYDRMVALINVYGPNSDDPVFFDLLFNKYFLFEESNCIIGGDFNLVMDVVMDKKGGLPKTYKKSNTMIKEYMQIIDLVDIWRITHPTEKKYTWRRRNPSAIFCRLDFFLISKALQGLTHSCNIISGFRSDHSIITLKLLIPSMQRGPGFWKFNCSLLADRNYVQMIRETLQICKEKYVDINAQLYWEMVKMEIRGKSISYSTWKKKENLTKWTQIEHDINELEQKEILTEEENENLEVYKNQIQTFHENTYRAAMIRSRTDQYEYGDKPTKYFLNLEKKNQEKKYLNQIRDSSGELVREKNKIMCEVQNFYDNLYSKKDSFTKCSVNVKNKFFDSTYCEPLDDTMKDTCEGLLTKEEIFKVLKVTANNKSPGIDGIPNEFYKFFWDDISDILVEALNCSYTLAQLSATQRRGVISLLPKDGKDITYVKNWRPITLLCNDYKLASKAIAERLRKHLPTLINCDQTGFIKGRYIGQNINILMYVLEIAENEQIPGVILSVDFEKAFDSLDWEYMMKVLDYCNFGPSFKNWIKLFHTNMNSTINVNGWFTPYIKICRGARQGDPIAPYLFILCAELLGNAIHNDNNINGIKISSMNVKISQFADDTLLYLDGRDCSLQNVLKVLGEFSDLSGLRVNYDKSTGFQIGQTCKTTTQILEKSIQWSSGPITTLGVKIPLSRLESIIDINYIPKIKDMDTLLKIWARRNLSMLGRATVVKSLAMSKLQYLATVLPFPNNELIKSVDTMINTFVWNFKNAKISKYVLESGKEEGGLGIPNFENVCKSSKLTWVKRYLDSERK